MRISPASISAAAAAISAAPAASGKSVRERLADLKALLDDGLIDEDDFKARKATILSDI